MSGKQVVFRDLDISERLRMVMVTDKLTVSQLADAAGVSKSAMEKYIAGPSSPRATSLASLCANLGIGLEWLVFGPADNDYLRVRGYVFSELFQLMHDLREEGHLRSRFESCDPGSREFRQFATDEATKRAEEIGAKMAKRRRLAMSDAAKGFAVTFGPVMPIPDEKGDRAK